jgi:membrane protease YdiL (CAAX protease family)
MKNNHLKDRISVFGGIHILNLANQEHQTFWVLSQVIWAFALGIMYAYLFIKSNSLGEILLNRANH